MYPGGGCVVFEVPSLAFGRCGKHERKEMDTPECFRRRNGDYIMKDAKRLSIVQM